MKLPSASTLLVVAVTGTVVSWTDAWSGCGPGCGYGVVIRPGGQVDTSWTKLIMPPERISRRRRQQLEQKRWRNRPQEFWDRPANPTIQSLPYQIRDTDREYTVTLDVPGVLPEELDVALEDDGQVLAISGEREKMSTARRTGFSWPKRFSYTTLPKPWTLKNSRPISRTVSWS